MLTRRRFLANSALACVATGYGFAASPTVDVKTPLGVVRGERMEGVRLFRGVPFAQPPVGELRFRPPLEPMPWSGVRNALQFAPAAVQPNGDAKEQSEDCLYLNVWTPDTPGPHPVFVWVHGGGFTGGRSSEAMFDGSTFAREGIVCVTVAYRLGVFGFMDWSPMLGETYAGSANNGLRDLIAALNWVQKNIASFGGDPKAVTLGGESAGAKLTDILMGVPAARPLFHQMISESGGAERVWSKQDARKIGEGWRAAWMQAAMPSSTEAALTADSSQIVKLQKQFEHDWPAHFPLRPELDDTLMQRWPLEVIRAGATRGKRLLLGTNLDESSAFIGPHPAKDPGAGDLGNLPVDTFAKIAAKYQTVYPEMPVELRRIRSTTAEEYWVPSIRVAEANIAGGGESFVYRLDFPEEKGRLAGFAFHSYELRFVWEHFEHRPSEAALALAKTIHEAWVSFIKGDVPAAPGLPQWPIFTPHGQKTMILNSRSRVEDRPHAAELGLWNGKLMQ